jgi:hypothetical protein
MTLNGNDFSDRRDVSGSRTPISANDFADFIDKTKAALIGVTGRRHIVPEAFPAVESAARAALRGMIAASDERPLYVATGLAIGADQLAAKLVLEAKAEAAAENAPSPLRLVALLPMSVAEYSSDFSTKPGTGETASASERDDFNRYLASADVVVEIEPTAENVERTRRGEAIDRMAQYAALGDFLVERSRLLWAFWSGDASNVKRGGTADVVLRKSRRVPNAVVDGERDWLNGVGFNVSGDCSDWSATSDFNAVSPSASKGVGDFSFGNPFEVDVSGAFASLGALGENGESAFCVSSVANFADWDADKGGAVSNDGRWLVVSDDGAFEAVCCVATPEVLRLKNLDGTKRRVPESTENAGKIAFWTVPSDARPQFEEAELALKALTSFWKKSTRR